MMTEDIFSSKKLDVIVQLPYVVKGENRRQQSGVKPACDIENAVSQDDFGIAYVDGTGEDHTIETVLSKVTSFQGLEWPTKQVPSSARIDDRDLMDSSRNSC